MGPEKLLLNLVNTAAPVCLSELERTDGGATSEAVAGGTMASATVSGTATGNASGAAAGSGAEAVISGDGLFSFTGICWHADKLRTQGNSKP